MIFTPAWPETPESEDENKTRQTDLKSLQRFIQSRPLTRSCSGVHKCVCVCVFSGWSRSCSVQSVWTVQVTHVSDPLGTSTPRGSCLAALSSSCPATPTRGDQSQRTPPTPRSSRPAWSCRRRLPWSTSAGGSKGGAVRLGGGGS